MDLCLYIANSSEKSLPFILHQARRKFSPVSAARTLNLECVRIVIEKKYVVVGELMLMAGSIIKMDSVCKSLIQLRNRCCSLCVREV